MAYVYILRSLKNSRLYTGSTDDLNRRLLEHSRGQSKYTKQTGPYILIYKEYLPTLFEAKRRERYLKTGKGREELKIVLSDAGVV